MVKRFLFKTRLGDLLLAWFERVTGLGIVEVQHLEQGAGWRVGW